MKLNIEDNRRRIFGVAIAVIIVGVIVGALLMSPSESKVKDELLSHSRAFFTKYADSTPISSEQEELLKGAAENIGNDSLFYNEMRFFGRKMFERGDQVLAFEYFKDIAMLLGEITDGSKPMMEYKGYCYLLLGAATDEVGLSSLSQGYYFSGMKIADKIESDRMKSDFYNNIGVSLYKSGSNDKAKSFFDTAMNMAKSTRNPYLMFILHNNMAEICSSQGDYDGAIDHVLKAIQNVDIKKNPEDYYSLQSALGSLYLDKGDLPMAYACLSNAYRNQDSTRNKAYLYDTSLIMSSYFMATSEPDSVKKYLAVAQRMAEIGKNPRHRIQLLEREAGMAAKDGDYSHAYSLEKQARELKDSLHNEENRQRIEQAHNIYEIERRAYENSIGISRWNPVVVFVSMSGLVVALIAFAAWIIVMKRKTDRINEEKAETASELAELRERQLAEERERKEKADEDLRLYHQKLTSFTLERLKTGSGIEDVAMETKKALLKVSPRDKELRTSLSDIISRLAALQSDTQWDEFQYYFEKVHPDFYATLDRLHPGLTAKERRLCALISLGLSTKDIAAIVCLEIRSVESSRNRLRKKLGLDNDEGLFEYIKGLMTRREEKTRTGTGLPEVVSEEQNTVSEQK